VNRSCSSRSRLRFTAAPASRLLVVALGLLLVLGSVAEAKGKGRITFAGVKAATTCIGGPTGGGRTSSYHLGWEAAKERNRRARIVYEIYQAKMPGGEDYSTPTYTTAPGALSFDTPQLPSEGAFYFVVRARDAAGNEDSNTAEREGQNLCV
jgi:hypothetical protein